MSQGQLFPATTPAKGVIVGHITGIESQPRNKKEWPPVDLPGVWVTIQKVGTKSASCREKHWIPDGEGNVQRRLVFDAHLNWWPVYVEDGVLKRAQS